MSLAVLERFKTPVPDPIEITAGAEESSRAGEYYRSYPISCGRQVQRFRNDVIQLLGDCVAVGNIGVVNNQAVPKVFEIRGFCLYS